MIVKWILVICEPFWNDSQVNFSDSDTVICKPFWNDSVWILICEPFKNDFWVNLSISQNILKWLSSESWWFVNHSKMILEQISVIHEPF